LSLLLAGGLAAAQPRDWRSGDALDQVLLQWRPSPSRTDLDAEARRLGLSGPKADPRAALHARAGAVGLQRAALLDIEAVRLPPGLSGADIDRILKAYRESPLVLHAEPDAPTKRAAPPNDTLFSNGLQWGLTATAWVRAWDAYHDNAFSFSAPVVVAVLDTGVDAHSELSGQLLSGASFVSGEATIDDRNGHGTFCAGLIAALPDNSSGIAGAFIDPAYVKILPVKVLGQCGGGLISGIVGGILYAVDQGARVLNMSLTTEAESSILHEAVREAQRRGAVLVAAAGNKSTATYWPAAYAQVIAVGALGPDDAPAWYSNFGKLDLSAPGGAGAPGCYCSAAPGSAACPAEVWSLAATVNPASCPSSDNVAFCAGGAYTAWGGTSFAAPLVSAAAAMLLAQDPGLSPEQVTQRLLQSAVPTSLGAGFHARAGWGKLDFQRALTLKRDTGPGAALRVYNWPNPFSPERDGGSTFSYFLPQSQDAELRLLDAGGDLVRRWRLGAHETWAGMNLLRWDGRNGSGRSVANGGYLLVLESGGQRATHRVAVLR
jgi:subtilisin family serine protease